MLQNEIITHGDGWYLTIWLETIVLWRLMYFGHRVCYVYKGISISQKSQVYMKLNNV